MNHIQTDVALQVIDDYIMPDRDVVSNIYLLYDVLLDISKSIIYDENLVEVYLIRALLRWDIEESRYRERLNYIPEKDDDSIAEYAETIFKWHLHTLEALNNGESDILPDEYKDAYERLLKT